MPRIRYIGGYKACKRRQEELFKQKNPQDEVNILIKAEEMSDYEEEENIPTQTFPDAKKTKFDTCGMPKRQIGEVVQRPFGGCTGDAAGNKFRSRSIGGMPLGLGRL